jgi:fatty acid omega-hydroxylase
LVRKKLLKVMESFARSQEAFDLQDVLLRLTFDNICIAGLGDDPGTLDSDLPLVPFAQAFEEATESTMFRFMIPPFIWKPLKFFDIGYEKGLRKAVDVVHEFVDKMVVDRIWFFCVIQKHPEVENKIIREISEILRQRGDSPTSKNESLFTVKELNDMVYLQAALSETMRLYPPIPMEMKQAIEDDVFPDGTFIRKGSRVYFATYAMGRMESIWGKDYR